jgi:cytochrome c biogenesis factor
MIRWIWAGGILVTVSAVVAALPASFRRRVRTTTTTNPDVGEDAKRMATAA